MKTTTSRQWVQGASTLIAGFSLCTLPAVAFAEVADIAWSEGGHFEQTLIVPPGKFAELCGALKPGQNVTWSFEAKSALNFNIHYHVGKEVRFPAKIEHTQGAHGEFLVDAAQDYCWMWTNKTAMPTTLKVDLTLKQAP